MAAEGRVGPSVDRDLDRLRVAPAPAVEPRRLGGTVAHPWFDEQLSEMGRRYYESAWLRPPDQRAMRPSERPEPDHPRRAARLGCREPPRRRRGSRHRWQWIRSRRRDHPARGWTRSLHPERQSSPSVGRASSRRSRPERGGWLRLTVFEKRGDYFFLKNAQVSGSPSAPRSCGPVTVVVPPVLIRLARTIRGEVPRWVMATFFSLPRSPIERSAAFIFPRENFRFQRS